MRHNPTENLKDVKSKNKEYNKTRGKNFISRFLSNPEIIPKPDPVTSESINEFEVFPLPDVDENEPIRSVKKQIDTREEPLSRPPKKLKKIISSLLNNVQRLPTKEISVIPHFQDTMNLPKENLKEGASKNLISALLNQRVKPAFEVEKMTKIVQAEPEKSSQSKNVISSILLNLESKNSSTEPNRSNVKHF